MFARTAEIITQKLQENNTVTSEQYDLCRFGFQQGLTILLRAKSSTNYLCCETDKYSVNVEGYWYS